MGQKISVYNQSQKLEISEDSIESVTEMVNMSLLSIIGLTRRSAEYFEDR